MNYLSQVVQGYFTNRHTYLDRIILVLILDLDKKKFNFVAQGVQRLSSKQVIRLVNRHINLDPRSLYSYLT